jgi:hypothetical protein
MGLINEQSNVTPIPPKPMMIDKTDTRKSKVYPVVSSFALGKFNITNTTDIDQAVQSIINDMKSYPDNQEFIVNISASESAIPPAKGTNPGDLAQKRLMAVETFIKSRLPQGKNIKITSKNLGVQGPDWETNKSKGVDWIEFKNAQRVDLSLQAIGSNNSKICQFSYTMDGGVAYAKDGFLGYTETIDIRDVPNGTKLTVGLVPYEAPDMLVVTSGNFNKSTGFITEGFGPGTYGEVPEELQTEVILMTTLFYGFNGQVPEHFVKGIGPLDEKYCLRLIFDWCSTTQDISEIKQIFEHVRDMSFVDEIQMSGNETYDVGIKRAGLEFLKRMPLYYSRATKNWYKKTDNHDGSDGYSGIDLVKQEGMDDLTIRVYSPLPKTAWRVFSTCS